MFHNFPAEIIRSGSSCNAGMELLSIPLLGCDHYCSKKVDKVLEPQELLLDFNNPQVEIQYVAKVFANSTILYSSQSHGQ